MEILLVDDNPNDAELAMRAIKRGRFSGRIVHVDDGVKAVDYLLGIGAYADRAGARQPRVVFLDLKMPRMDGIGVLRRVKAEVALRPVPIVMLTSSREPPDIVECYRLGVNSYVVKPVNFDEYEALMAALVHYWTRLNLPPLATAVPG